MVLFVICIQNWIGYNAFRLNSAQFSAHPGEHEVILNEGFPLAVIAREDLNLDYSKKTEDPYWSDFNGKKLTVFYLFNAFDI